MTKDVPDIALVLGNPAKIVGWVKKASRLVFDEDGLSTCAQYKKIEGFVRFVVD